MDRRVIIFGKRFAALRRDRFLTQEEFAQRLEMSPANIRRLEQCESGGMQVKNFRRLAAMLNVSPADLRQQIGPAVQLASSDVVDPSRESLPGVPGFPSGIDVATTREIVDVPHYHGVSAARTEHRTDAHRGRKPVPVGASRRFAVTVDGDCMEPKYHHGETVVFSVDAAEREGIVDGKNYFVQFADGENTFKRVFLDPENRELLILRGWNERYPARVVERSKVKLLARAIFRLTPDE